MDRAGTIEALEAQGYAVLPGVLDDDRVERLKRAVDRVATERPGEAFNVTELFVRDRTFIELTTLPEVLPVMMEVLGRNIWVNHAHVNVSPPHAYTDQPVSYMWHHDGGRIYDDLGAQPRLSVRVGFYLTDQREPGTGQTFVLPGSHREARAYPPENELPADAVPLVMPPGSIVFYDGRLVHSLRSPNASASTRMVVFLQFAFRWLAAMSSVARRVELDDGLSPVERQLLGLGTSFHDVGDGAEGRSGRYYPRPQDAPLCFPDGSS